MSRSHEPARAKPEAEPVEPPVEPVLRIEAKPLGLLRCPYCHDDVPAEAQDYAACRACMARHHLGCWNENKRCATCSHAKALKVVHGKPGGRRRFSLARREAAGRRDEAASQLAYFAIGGVVLSVIGVFFMLDATHARSPYTVAIIIVATLVAYGTALLTVLARSAKRDEAFLEEVRARVRAHRLEHERDRPPA